MICYGNGTWQFSSIFPQPETRQEPTVAMEFTINKSPFAARLKDPTDQLPSVKLTTNYGKSPFLMGKLTISMAIFNSFLYVYQRVSHVLIKF